MQMTAKTISDKLISAYGNELISLISYGSKNTQFLILTKSGDIGVINQHHQCIGKLAPHYQFTIMTETEFQNAIDVFPIEFLDIQSHHTCHFGPNIIQDISVNFTNLRHECEYTLRSHVLKLRAALLTHKPPYLNLINESFPTIKAALTAIFRLHKQDLPVGEDAWYDALTTLTNTNITPLRLALNTKAPTASHFQGYLDTLSALTEHVNDI